MEQFARPIPFIPSNAPFSAEQRAWLNGYFVGLLSSADAPGLEAAQPSALAAQAEPLLILYGSQTGTAEQLAKKLGKEASSRGFKPRVAELNSVAPSDLANEKLLLIVTSTWGDGEPPDNAGTFWSKLSSEDAPKLPQLNYSVLALGDKNYSDFCGAGRKFDTRLTELGAAQLHPRADCDVDYEPTANGWISAVLVELSKLGKTSSNASAVVPAAVVEISNGNPSKVSMQFDRKNPFPARLVANRRLNGPGSGKDTRHFEISLEGSGLTYEPGDALGVMPQNCPDLVSEILQALGCNGDETVKDALGNDSSLRQALQRTYDIRQPNRSLLEAISRRDGTGDLSRLLDDKRKAELEEFLSGREIVDLLLAFPKAMFSPEEFVSLLRKLQPRLYSISSSLKAHPCQVHLTVAAVRYESHGRHRKGVCSTFLADRADNGTSVPVFVQKSHGFRLPEDTSKPIIMIGPGTGVAPFRAFLEERRETGANGKSWLFFGDQQRQCDFLYETEMNEMLRGGSLSRLDTAFSRDQKEKIYVQHRMLDRANELWGWLEEGAHVYVCGDAKRMARDVDQALHSVVQNAGGKTSTQAAEYVQSLKQTKRYQRDVY